jgi:single-strand DNA-binding protein
MSNDLNSCNFIGRMVRDPEVRFAASGTAMCNFTLACGWKTKEKEGTEFVRVVAYNKLAEIIGEYMKKGSQMFISGRMSTREYEKDGAKRYSTEVIADRMQMLGHAKGSEDAPKPKQAPAQIEDIADDLPF